MPSDGKSSHGLWPGELKSEEFSNSDKIDWIRLFQRYHIHQNVGKNMTKFIFFNKFYVDHDKMHNIFEAMYLYDNINTL